jgi:urea-proton symporter
MAIMSTYSSELIAVSSIVTYDIYKTYINPAATGKQLMRVNYIGMVCFALFMAAFATALYYIGISMGYLYVLMGVIISSAVLPATLTLLWADQSWAAATFSPILGFVCSVTSWLVRTKVKYGDLTVNTTGSNDPMLVGNIVSLLAPVVFIPLLTYLPPFKPQKYDWESMRNIRKVDDHDIANEAHMDLERIPGEHRPASIDEEQEQIKLAKAAKIARWLTVFLTLALLVLWPMPLFGSGYIFSKKFFTGWVVVGILWLFVSTVICVFLPLFESRSTIARTVRLMTKDLLGIRKGRPLEATEGEIVEGAAASTDSPPNGKLAESVGVKKTD